MSVLSINNIEKSYGITEVLRDFSLFINEGERVGLIGPNGSGKTTVFKIIAGNEPYSQGSIALKKEANIGYLSQMPDFELNKTLFQELETVFIELIRIEAQLRKLEAEISNNGKKKDKDKNLEKLLADYSQLQHRFEIEGGYQYQSQINQVALGLGFSLEELNKKVKSLSGGEKTRLGLAKLLLTKPDLLLLDEPTNHLDLPAIQWLEDYLNDYQGAVIIISHDRYFLDKVVERIVEVKHGRNEVYHGNYSFYLEERKRRYEQRLHAYENQQKKIEQMEAAIDRLERWGRQGDNSKFFKRAQSMQKALDKIERLDKPILDGKRMGLDLAVNKRSGREVLKITNLFKSFGNTPILTGLDLNVYWGEKVALIGRNGTGKTTLIKIILDSTKQDQGEVKVGVNVKIGYYSQEFTGFDPEDDLVTALRRECEMTTAEARNALAAFLFTEDEVFQKVSTLSGGEKSRLRLLQLMNGDYNFLVLDEPTNHLDLPSREILEETLLEYPGTILVVSHDRYFLNKFSDLTYELEDGSLTKYYGNYDYYRQKKEELKLVMTDDEQNESDSQEESSDYHRLKRQIRQERKRKNRLNNLETEIEELENLRKELEMEMAKPENLQEFQLLNQLKEKYEASGTRLKRLYSEWEEYLEEG